MFKTCESKSPVAQDMIWVAEYDDQKLFSEFDILSKKENSFYDIEKEKLERFGLIGNGHKMWFECNGGSFNVFSQKIDIAYRVNDKIYNLTNNGRYLNDIITYKKAYADIIEGQRAKSNIVAYYYGYKKTLVLDDFIVNFKPIVCVPVNESIYMSASLVSNKDIAGQIIFLKENVVIEQFEAPLTASIGGNIDWQIK